MLGLLWPFARMFWWRDRFAGDAASTTGPLPQVDQFATLGAKRAERRFFIPGDGLFAGGAGYDGRRLAHSSPLASFK